MDFDIIPAGHAVTRVNAPFPFVKTNGSGALVMLSELRRSFQDACPVIWGDEENASQLFQSYGEDADNAAQASLAVAKGKSAADLISERDVVTRASIEAWYAKRGQAAPAEKVDVAPHGLWPQDALPNQVPLALIDIHTGRPKGEVLIGLVPTARSWEIPAFHEFGGWNDCPIPAIHAAAAREWSEAYGAKLIVNTKDTIEFEIASPIASRDEALAVAELQFRYCSDIVHQGTQTIEALAASLIGAKYWFFWWD